MMLTFWIHLTLAQELVPERPPALGEPPAVAVEAAAASLEGTEDTLDGAEQPLEGAEDAGEEEVEDTGTPTRAWEVPADDAARQDVLGPWPDGFEPGRDFQRGLDLVDPLSDIVLQAGDPYVDGLLHGPIAPVQIEQVEQVEQVEAVEPSAPELQTSPVELPPVEPGVEESVPPTVVVQMPEAGDHWRILPVTPEPSLRKALISGLAAILLLLLARGLERGPLQRLPQRGLVPLGLRTVVVALRLGVLTLVLLAGLLALPRSLSPAPAYVFVSLAIAVGWTSRHVLQDVLAGVVLVIEHRITPGARIHLPMPQGVMQGLVRGVGLRFVEVDSDDGRQVAVPNRTFLDHVVTRDDNSHVPVEVCLHVPFDQDARHVRRVLEELALLSPWLAPVGTPEIHRDTALRDVWIVRARLVGPEHAMAFRGTMVELADEVLGARRE
jgi:hypothetical protein